jgi:hypothetical protein
MSFNTSKPIANTNRFLNVTATAATRQTFAHRSTGGAGDGATNITANTFGCLNSFISSSHNLPQAPSQSQSQQPSTTPYDKNADFPALPSATITSTSSTSSTPSISYRCVVVASAAMDARQQAEQARIQNELKKELEARELAYEKLRRDTARSRDVATALAAAANYDISDISDSIVD